MVGVETSPRVHGDAEIADLVEAIWSRYGYDHRGWIRESFGRRVRRFAEDEGFAGVGDLTERLVRDPSQLDRLHLALAAGRGGPFRDAAFLRAFRERLVPVLRTWPFVRIWYAGAGLGAEVWALAIVLREEGLGERATIYATELSEAVLAKAREGIQPLDVVEADEEGYRRSGGRSALAEYFVAEGGRAVLRPSLRERIVFAQHDLTSGGSLNEFQVVLCRTALAVLASEARMRAYGLLHESLCRFGTLGIGNGSSLMDSPWRASYEGLDPEHGLYRRVR